MMLLLINWYSENWLSVETNKGGSSLHRGSGGTRQMNASLNVAVRAVSK